MKYFIKFITIDYKRSVRSTFLGLKTFDIMERTAGLKVWIIEKTFVPLNAQ